MKKLLILISNDDGIHAPGINALAEEIKKIGDVVIVAPDKQQSAVGHAITMNSPLRVQKVDKQGTFFGYAVTGTPADAVKLAVRSLLPHPPDLVISGINHGSNTAISVIYSGTVSAATEGTILGIPSFAISLTTYDEADFSYAAVFARKLSLKIIEQGLPKGTLLNVNVPPVPASEITRNRHHETGKICLERRIRIAEGSERPGILLAEGRPSRTRPRRRHRPEGCPQQQSFHYTYPLRSH